MSAFFGPSLYGKQGGFRVVGIYSLGQWLNPPSFQLVLVGYAVLAPGGYVMWQGGPGDLAAAINAADHYAQEAADAQHQPPDSQPSSHGM